MFKRNIAVVGFALVFSVVFFAAYDAFALRVSMKRVIFEGRNRSEVLTIINNSAKTVTYRLALRHYTIGDTKGLRFIKEEDLEQYPEIKWADDYLSYAPKRFTIEPGGSQQIRLFAKKPRDLAPGEYRSHLWITSEIKPEPYTDEEKAQKGGRSVRLAMQPGISLPVFMRQGDISSNASMENGSLELVAKKEGGQALVAGFTLAKQGEKSIYGNFDFYCTAGSGEFLAKSVKGFAIYAETEYRNLKFNVGVPEDKSLSDCNSMRIEYKADDDDSTYAGKTIASINVSR